MANMSYCKFENTVIDMRDCINTLHDFDGNIEEMMTSASSPYEARAMKKFLRLCEEVANEFVYEDY